MSIDWGRALPVLGGAFIVWAIWAYTHPFVPCPRCRHRRGRNAGSTARRWGKCGRCGGNGQVKALGSRALHRAWRSIKGNSGWGKW